MDAEKAKQALLDRLAELEELANISSEARAPVELDQQSVGRLSRMDAIQGQAMAQETARRRQREQQCIESALQRIEDGDYGYCLQCDEEIADARLSLDPAVALCVNCAK